MRTAELERKLRDAGLSPNSSPDPRGDMKPPASPDGDDDDLRSSEEVVLFETSKAQKVEPEPEPEPEQPPPSPARDSLQKGRVCLMQQDAEGALKHFERGLVLLQRPPPRNGAVALENVNDAAVGAELQFEVERSKAELAAAAQTDRQRVQQQDVTEACKSGWLHKKGDTFKSFKRRYFQLDFGSSSSTAGGSAGGGGAHPRIAYFEREGGELKGTIELTGEGLSFESVRACDTDLLKFQVRFPPIFPSFSPHFPSFPFISPLNSGSLSVTNGRSQRPSVRMSCWRVLSTIEVSFQWKNPDFLF